MNRSYKNKHLPVVMFGVLLLGSLFFAPVPTSAVVAPEPTTPPPTDSTGSTDTIPDGVTTSTATGNVCGGPTHDPVKTSINIGCVGKGNPMADALFAIIRFLSAGVGLVVIASIIFGGIQYTASRGDPQATAKAIERIRSSVIALIIFIFGFAILGYLIPAGVLK